MFEQACRRIETAVTPFLEKKLDQVRKYKESNMTDTPRVSTYKCAICGASGMKAPRYVKSHMSSKHKDVPKEEHPDPVEVLPVGENAPKPEPLTEPVEEPAGVATPAPEVVAPPVGLPPVSTPEPPAAPTEIAVGSVIELKGPQWKLDPITSQWVGFSPDGVQVDVISKAPGADGMMMLSCRTVAGTDLWSVPEPRVLDGTLLLVKDAGATDSSADPKELLAIQMEMDEFKKRAAEYVKVRDAFIKHEKAMESSKEKHRDFLVEAIKKYGYQSDGSPSWLMEAVGFYSQVVVTIPDPQVVYDEDVIVKFLMENGLDDYLSRPGFDREKWELLKTLKNGEGVLIVDAAFVESVEQVETPGARESLRITATK